MLLEERHFKKETLHRKEISERRCLLPCIMSVVVEHTRNSIIAFLFIRGEFLTSFAAYFCSFWVEIMPVVVGEVSFP